jgi:hypothetical protein
VSTPLKPGDLVRTPSGRTARVEELRTDGRRDLRFVDGDRGEAALRPEKLTIIARAPVLPWTRHRL